MFPCHEIFIDKTPGHVKLQVLMKQDPVFKRKPHKKATVSQVKLKIYLESIDTN